MLSRSYDKMLPVLASAIVVQAIKDYKRMLRGEYIPKESIPHIEQFFKSSYCQDLMFVAGLEVDPDRMIDSIRQHLDQVDKHWQF